MNKTIPNKLMILFSFLLVMALVLSNVLPAAAADVYGPNLVVNGSFETNTNWTSIQPGSWNLTGGNAHHSPRSPIEHDPLVDTLTQCLVIDLTPDGAKFMGSAVFSDFNAGVFFEFYNTNNCGPDGTAGDTLTLDKNDPNNSGFPYQPVNATQIKSILIKVMCGYNADCVVDDISLTATTMPNRVGLLNLKGTNKNSDWFIPIGLLAIILTGSLAAFWKFRRFDSK